MASRHQRIKGSGKERGTKGQSRRGVPPLPPGEGGGEGERKQLFDSP